MISVLRGNTTIDYALTDAKGQFSLPWKHSGTLQLNISLLGYKREMRNINAAGTLNLSLQAEAIVLKEVQIRPGRINTRKDTVRYDYFETIVKISGRNYVVSFDVEAYPSVNNLPYPQAK